MLLCYVWYLLAKWNVPQSGWKDDMSSATPLWIIQTQRGIGFRTSRLDFMPALGAIRPPLWQGIWLEYISAVLQQSVLKSLRKDYLPEMQNSSFVKYSVQKWNTVNMTRSVVIRQSAWTMPGTLPRQVMHCLFTPSRPPVRQQAASC